jgi:hypothetical protein
MGGFSDWVEEIADSGSAHEYRKKVSPSEVLSMWQGLSFGTHYRAAYCMAVCPEGEDVIATFVTHREEHLENVLRPFQNKPETVYVVPKSDAETAARYSPLRASESHQLVQNKTTAKKNSLFPTTSPGPCGSLWPNRYL